MHWVRGMLTGPTGPSGGSLVQCRALRQGRRSVVLGVLGAAGREAGAGGRVHFRVPQQGHRQRGAGAQRLARRLLPLCRGSSPEADGLTTWSTRGRAASCGCCREGEERVGGRRAAVARRPAEGRRQTHRQTQEAQARLPTAVACDSPPQLTSGGRCGLQGAGRQRGGGVSGRGSRPPGRAGRADGGACRAQGGCIACPTATHSCTAAPSARPCPCWRSAGSCEG